jgi:hypothetical protein
MYTSIVLTALAGLMVSRAPLTEVAWSSDYSAARQSVTAEGKPLAVFFGSGENGYEQVCRDGTLSKASQDVLSNNYVCLYVDLESTAGRRLAKSFSITQSTGLVLSDSTGTKQAFRHNGAVSGKDLTVVLNKYSDPNLAVRSTTTTVAAAKRAPNAQGRRAGGVGARRSNYAPSYGYPIGFGGGCAGGNCGGGGCAGGGVASYGYPIGFGGGCAGGNCGGGGCRGGRCGRR